jgi:hypothetical protein
MLAGVDGIEYQQRGDDCQHAPLDDALSAHRLIVCCGGRRKTTIDTAPINN